MGAGLARELSTRGIKNLFLIEKNDFASGTSGASSKLIHAGIRYLEQAWIRIKKGQFISAWINFKFVVQASWERKILGVMAPHLSIPLRLNIYKEPENIIIPPMKLEPAQINSRWSYFCISKPRKRSARA